MTLLVGSGFVLAALGLLALGLGAFKARPHQASTTEALRSRAFRVAPRKLARTTAAVAWKAVILVVGGSVLVLGAAMVVLPGPAVVVIPLGLAILATRFLWARRLLERVRTQVQDRMGRAR